MRESIYLTMIMVFVPFSLTSIGGGASIIAGVQNEAVVVHRWISQSEFLDLFAISRAAPGPGSMLVTLIGWTLAGWPGAITATLAIYLPSSLLCLAVVRVSNAHRERRWYRAAQEGLAPIGTALVLAGVLTIARLAGSGWPLVAVAGLVACILALRPTLPAILVLSAGAAVYSAIDLAM